MLSRIVVYLEQWQYWSSEAQFDDLIACVSQARMQLGMDAFWGPVCAKANADHKVRSRTTRVVEVNMKLACKRMDAKILEISWDQTVWSLSIYYFSFFYGQWLRIRWACSCEPLSLLFRHYPCSIYRNTMHQTGERRYPPGSLRWGRLWCNNALISGRTPWILHLWRGLSGKATLE
jgi:hypothetical protein